MPIVLHKIDQAMQADGGAQVTVRLYDQDGTEYTTGFRAPEGFDVSAKVQNMIAEQDEQLAQSEFESLVGL